MVMTLNGKSVIFESVVYEDQVVALRDYLTEIAPENLEFDFNKCDDIHMAVLQQILAYKKVYNCSYSFSDSVKTYQKILEGFEVG